MSVTLSTLATFIDDAQRAYINQGITLINASRKGSRQFGSLLTKDLLVASMLQQSKAFIPSGTVVTPAEGGAAIFDLSTYVSAIAPNCNDVRIDIIRLDSSPITIFDGRIDKQGLTEVQWVAAIAAAADGGGGGYAATSDGTELSIMEPDSTTDTGDIRIRIYAYTAPDFNPIYTYFDWTTINPALITRYYGGCTGNVTNIVYTVDAGSGESILVWDGLGALISNQLFVSVGVPSRPVPSPWESGRIYLCNSVSGLIQWVNSSLGNTGDFGVAVTPISTKADAIYSVTTGFIYFINGGNYQKINAVHTVTNSTAIAIPNDEFLTLNLLNGIPFSYSTAGTICTELADSGALTTHTLSVAIAGRIGSYNNNYYVPCSGTRRVYLFNTSFTATAFIDFSTVTGWTVTSNVKDVYIFDDLMYVIHTDGNVSVVNLSSGAFVSTFFTGVTALSLFTATAQPVYYMGASDLWEVEDTDEITQTQIIQDAQGAIVWTAGDNCLTDEQQTKLMGKVSRAWNIAGCGNGLTGGAAPIGGGAALLLTSDGQALLNENSEFIIQE